MAFAFPSSSVITATSPSVVVETGEVSDMATTLQVTQLPWVANSTQQPWRSSMGFMDKAKELAAKADQAISGLDGPTPGREAEPLFRDLGAKVFEREQGRADERITAEIGQIL